MKAGAPRRGSADWLPVAGAFLASLVLIWAITREPLVVAAYGAALAVLGGFICVVTLRRPAIEEADFGLPDWSVTITAIETPDSAVAIIDRAGRLVCANARYEEWFEAGNAPPRLPVDEASLDRLAGASRAGWRDGRARAAPVENERGCWKAEVVRTGRGEDFLVWRFLPIVSVDPVTDLVERLDGKLGRSLDRAGIAAAIVDPDGLIRAATTGFAERATGDALGSTIGREFVSLLRQENGDRIGWAHEGKRGTPLTLYHFPVVDPDAPGKPDPDLTPSLLLLVEASAGIGGGHSEVSAAAPHLEALLGQLPLGLGMADRDGRLLFANPAFMRAAGREGEAPPTYPTDLVVREDKGVLSDAIRRHAQGPATAGEVAVRLAARPDEPVSLGLAAVRGLGEAAVLLSLTDGSEETRLKRQAAQATKMQAVDRLASGIAHDYDNALTAILASCDLMLLRHMPGAADYDDIRQIHANASRAAALTRQLLAFSRQQALLPEVVQLPDIVAETSPTLKRLIGEKIRLAVSHDRDLGPVRVDPAQFGQVIVNLAANARDAMLPRGGKLTLMTRRVTAADVRRMRSEIIPISDYTALIVEDTGSGIAPEHLGRIWEPFFTTGEQGKGAGLGLAAVYGIVKQSGGFIFADSEVGRNGQRGGTRFTIYLPVCHDTPAMTVST
ncbi:MAG: PAS domain-containing protein [Novosphingobium sp.]|jgi:two-component system cell cycle sensor histidine kinase/response regulator CckA|nr:PAS domain-containing protein [Novosphingobium sp.]